MTELKIEAYSLPEAPKFNYEELKTALIERTRDYKTTVYGEDQIKQAKADRSELNKISKALNDERIRLEKEYNKPFSVFKDQVNEVIGIIKDASGAIDEQVKAFEAKEKQEKEAACRELFGSKNTYDWLGYEQLAKPTWINKSTKLEAIGEEIDIALATIETSMNALQGLEYEFEATEFYKKSLSLTGALDENRRLSEMAKKKAEAEARAEEQRKAAELARSERERREAEEEKTKLEAEEAVKSDIKQVVETLAESVKEEKYEMTLKLRITSYEYDQIEMFLNSLGAEWSMT